MRHRNDKSKYVRMQTLLVQGVDSLSLDECLYKPGTVVFRFIQMNILLRVINSATVDAAAAVTAAAIVHPLQAQSKKFHIFQATFYAVFCFAVFSIIILFHLNLVC